MSGQPQLKGVLLPAAIVLAISLAALLFPPLGVLIVMFSPAPLIVVSLRGGKQAGFIASGLVLLVLLVVMGAQQALFFFAEYAVMAMIIAEALRRQLPFDKCILFSVLGSAVLSGVLLLLVFSGREVSLTEFLQQQVSIHFEQSLEALKSMEGDNIDLTSMEQLMEKTSRTFAASYPAIVLVGSLMAALVNYSVARWVMRRFYGDTHFFSGTFSSWVLPDFFIWIFIFSATSLFFPEGEMKKLGLNAFIVMAVVYCLQGMAVAVHFLAKKSVPFFLWVIVFLLIFSQPMLIGVLLGLGLFDLWLDFRKLRVKLVVDG